jgi:pyridinium-3,5-bisthiocarboxylic acid mononucleotide nickel chelatase
MRIAYLDCFSGMSGDMFLGALLDAGVPASLFEETVNSLNLGASFETSRVDRNGIAATKVDVYVNGEKELPREVFWEQQPKHAHEPEHRLHSHSQAHRPEPVPLTEHNYLRTEAQEASRPTSAPAAAALVKRHEHGRGLPDIKKIISQAAIAETIKSKAITIFDALAAAEAKVHNCDIESIHFHEVGAVDAMVDIVCAAAGVEALGVNEIVCSPLNVGGGTVKCAHGIFPVPAPATIELLKNVPIYSSGIQVELVTPTGAAIVKTLATRFAPFPEMRARNIGYGAGTRELPGHANVVRLTIGDAQPESLGMTSQDAVTILEANLDDLNPQVFGYVMDRLLQEGALDAFGIPVQMKKSRPGILLTVLGRAEDAEKLIEIIFLETTTLGVRQRTEKRRALSRNWVRVHTRWGDVRMKIASMNGTVTNYSPEYEDCRRLAAEHHVPLRSVMQEAVLLYLSKVDTH